MTSRSTRCRGGAGSGTSSAADVRRAGYARRVSVGMALALSWGGAACGSDEPSAAADAPTAEVISGAGADAEAIRSTVERYKAKLGTDNGGEPGAVPTGFRTINWDGVPDDQAAPAFLPGDFFNANTAPRARGAVLETIGEGVQASATGAYPRFAHIDATYAASFRTFSGERLFSPVGSNVVDLTFRVPGSDTPAAVRGFGAVYTDVDTDHTAFEYFDTDGGSLGSYPTPVADGGLSFLGVLFEEPIVARVRISYGTAALGSPDGADNDVAVMDDFIYGEPQAIDNG